MRWKIECITMLQPGKRDSILACPVAKLWILPIADCNPTEEPDEKPSCKQTLIVSVPIFYSFDKVIVHTIKVYV